MGYNYKNMHNFENLRVYQRGLDITDDIYTLTSKFPKDEVFGLTNQLRRAIVSIVLNIAEGSGRTKKDFRHFLNMSRTSAYESTAILEIAKRRKYISDEEFKTFYHQLEIIIKMINKLRSSIHD